MDALTFDRPVQFYLFLFVHTAYTDYQMHTKEIQYILDKLKELVVDQVDVYEQFLELKDQYETMSNENIELTIDSNFPKFKDDPLQRNLLSWLSGVIQADGVVKDAELSFFGKIKQAMEDPTTH